MSRLPVSSAAERNRQPILKHLARLLPESGAVLEVGSGTGQHAVYFASQLPNLQWQPSERTENLEGLKARIDMQGTANILPPIALDVTSDPWPGRSYEAAYSANTAHIMCWEAVVAMFSGFSAHLLSCGAFYLYGPFNVGNRFTSPGNAVFDARLRAENPQMGIRDMGRVEALASLWHMELANTFAMPANNFLLQFVKT